MSHPRVDLSTWRYIDASAGNPTDYGIPDATRGRILARDPFHVGEMLQCEVGEKISWKFAGEQVVGSSLRMYKMATLITNRDKMDPDIVFATVLTRFAL